MLNPAIMNSPRRHEGTKKCMSLNVCLNLRELKTFFVPWCLRGKKLFPVWEEFNLYLTNVVVVVPCLVEAGGDEPWKRSGL